MVESSPTKSRSKRRKESRRLKRSQQQNKSSNDAKLDLESRNVDQLDTFNDYDQSTDQLNSSSQDSTPVKSRAKAPNEVASTPVRGYDGDHKGADNPDQTTPNTNEDMTKSRSDQACDNDQLEHKPTHSDNIVNSNGEDKAKRKSQIRERFRDYRELKERFESQNSQMANLTECVKQQAKKIRELEALILTTTRTCNQLEKLLQQEVSSRNKLEQKNVCLNQTVTRLRTQIGIHEKNKLTNDELMRTINATLMERETEISLLKLKLTRLQTNPVSNSALNTSVSSVVSTPKNDPHQAFISSGKSVSEFDRSSRARTSSITDSRSNILSSTSQLRTTDNDALIWASVPSELTPSKRPQLLEKNFQAIYSESRYGNPSNNNSFLERNKRYRTMPSRSMKNSDKETEILKAGTSDVNKGSSNQCLVTNLDDNANNKNCNPKLEAKEPSSEKIQSSDLNVDKICTDPQSQPANKSTNDSLEDKIDIGMKKSEGSLDRSNKPSNCISIDKQLTTSPDKDPLIDANIVSPIKKGSASPTKFSDGFKKIFGKFRRSDSNASSSSKTEVDSTPSTPFKRGADRATLAAFPGNIRTYVSPKAMDFHTDKPFAEWDTDMIVEWMTKIGLSMYTAQCRRWVKCGAHIMNATPLEVDKGLGIINHLHRKKLRLAISELNGDCDKVTKAASKLDYLWVARWLDEIGLPQYKEAFINARVDGRVLNYLTIDDLVSMGVKSVLHHASIRCGIKVLRTIEFDLQLLKRRATAEEIDEMNNMRQQVGLENGMQSTPTLSLKQKLNQTSPCHLDPKLPLWTCHRIMEWLRLIDFAEFAPNMRGSGVHGGLIAFEDGFNIDTMCSLLSIPLSKTLLRRHLSTYFEILIGKDVSQKKKQFQELSSNPPLNPLIEVKTPKKKPLWFGKLKGSKVGQNVMDDYLCPMYPVDTQILKNSNSTLRKGDVAYQRDGCQLDKIPESINV